VLKDLISGEMLLPVSSGYALPPCGRPPPQPRAGILPAARFLCGHAPVPSDTLKPRLYPRFSLNHLDGIVEKIPDHVTSSNELLDDPSLEGWILSEPAVYEPRALHRPGGKDGVEALRQRRWRPRSTVSATR